jgi:hypothetical protein
MINVSMVVLAQFFTAVAPECVLGRLNSAFGGDEYQFHLMWMMPVYFLVSCSFNPIVYGIGDKTFHEGYKITLRKICACK